MKLITIIWVLILSIYFGWLINPIMYFLPGMVVLGVYLIEGSFIRSQKVNPTHIEFEGKKYKTLTELINSIRKEGE